MIVPDGRPTWVPSAGDTWKIYDYTNSATTTYRFTSAIDSTSTASFIVQPDTYTTINQWFAAGTSNSVYQQALFQGQALAQQGFAPIEQYQLNVNAAVWQVWSDQQVMSAEQRERLAQAQLQAQLQEQQRVVLRATAGERARAVLAENLNAEQRAEWEKNGHFHVVTKRGMRYLITRGTAGNVFLVDKGRRVGRYCIHPPDNEIPAEDVMLMQKLWLEAHEAEFLKIANHTRLAA